MIALFVVLVFFSIMAPNFLSVASGLIMAKHIALIAILAIGMTYVVLIGGIDLSVGSIAGLSGMVAGALILNGLTLAPLDMVIYPSVLGVVLVVALLGAAIGLINGVIITRFNVAPSSRRSACCMSRAAPHCCFRAARPSPIWWAAPNSATPAFPFSARAASSAFPFRSCC